jgi:hypothetical protein
MDRRDAVHIADRQERRPYGYNPLFAALGALDVIRALVLWAMLRGREDLTTR